MLGPVAASDADNLYSLDGGCGRGGCVVQEGRSDAEGAVTASGAAVVLFVVDARNRRSAAAARAHTQRLDTDYSSLGAHACLSGCHDNSVLAVDGRRNTGSDAGTGSVRGPRNGGSVRVAGDARVGRVAQFAGDEEVRLLVEGWAAGGGVRCVHRDRRHGRDEESRRSGRRSVRNAGNVGDLDYVGSSSQYCGRNRVDGVC